MAFVCVQTTFVRIQRRINGLRIRVDSYNKSSPIIIDYIQVIIRINGFNYAYS